MEFLSCPIKSGCVCERVRCNAICLFTQPICIWWRLVLLGFFSLYVCAFAEDETGTRKGVSSEDGLAFAQHSISYHIYIHTLYMNALIFSGSLAVVGGASVCHHYQSPGPFWFRLFFEAKIKLLHQYNVVSGPVRNQNQHTYPYARTCKM